MNLLRWTESGNMAQVFVVSRIASILATQGKIAEGVAFTKDFKDSLPIDAQNRNQAGQLPTEASHGIENV